MKLWCIHWSCPRNHRNDRWWRPHTILGSSLNFIGGQVRNIGTGRKFGWFSWIEHHSRETRWIDTFSFELDSFWRMSQAFSNPSTCLNSLKEMLKDGYYMWCFKTCSVQWITNDSPLLKLTKVHKKSWPLYQPRSHDVPQYDEALCCTSPGRRDLNPGTGNQLQPHRTTAGPSTWPRSWLYRAQMSCRRSFLFDFGLNTWKRFKTIHWGLSHLVDR